MLDVFFVRGWFWKVSDDAVVTLAGVLKIKLETAKIMKCQAY